MSFACTLALFALLTAPPQQETRNAPQHETADSASPKAALTGPDASPLPPVADLLLAVEKNEDRDEAALLQYTYHSHFVFDEFDGNDTTRKTTVKDFESIPINGVRVNKLVAINGKTLDPEAARKENDRFDKAVADARKRKDKRDEKAAEQQAQGKPNTTIISAARVLELGTFSNERRVDLNGRPTIVLDYAGTRGVKTRSPMEKIVEDLVGTVWIDEQDKVLARTEGRFLADFKLGLGLLVDIHKGLSFTMEQQKINGEVWLPKHFGGEGKASVLLVVARVHGHSSADMSDFRKYHASATIVGSNGAIDEQGNPVPAETPPGPLAPPPPPTPK